MQKNTSNPTTEQICNTPFAWDMNLRCQGRKGQRIQSAAIPGENYLIHLLDIAVAEFMRPGFIYNIKGKRMDEDKKNRCKTEAIIRMLTKQKRKET